MFQGGSLPRRLPYRERYRRRAVAHFENILRVLPDTTTVAVVTEEMRREGKRFADRIAFVWYNDLPFEEVLKKAAELPPNSAIYWHLANVDAAGVVHDNDRALQRLYAVANAPIFFRYVFWPRDRWRPDALASRGEPRESCHCHSYSWRRETERHQNTATGFATPKFDWREMQRWGISERRLLPGSEIHFRDPTAWGQYRVHILLACALFFLQFALISWLLYERRKRRRSETAGYSAGRSSTHRR